MGVACNAIGHCHVKKARCSGASERNTDTSRVGERVYNRMLVQDFENRQSQGEQGCQRLASFCVCSNCPVSVVLGTVDEIRD